MPRATRIELPQRQRNYRFAMTPLADAMFQLLIFFMLASGLTPYSLLTLQSAPAMSDSPAGAGGAAEQATAPGAKGEIALWSIEPDALVIGGQRFGFDELDALAAALGDAGMPAQVVLIVRPNARVQDVTTVLAGLRRANVGSVQVSRGDG